MEDELKGLVDYLEEQLERREDRILLSIASIPGGGKSTLAFLLAQSLNRVDQRAKVVGLDGWHYSRAQLDQFSVSPFVPRIVESSPQPSSGQQDPEDAHFRRGAEDTFDAESYGHFIRSLSEDSRTREGLSIAFPTFSHIDGDPIPPPIITNGLSSTSTTESTDSSERTAPTPDFDEAIIHPFHRLIIVEGLYTQLDTPRWRAASESFDEKWRIDVERKVARERLIARHLRTGVCATMKEAVIRGQSLHRSRRLRMSLGGTRSRLISVAKYEFTNLTDFLLG